MELSIDGQILELNEEGFLCDMKQWSRQVALVLAEQNSVKLTDAHWEIILFIRAYFERFQHLPNARQFAKAIRTQLGEDKGNSRYLLALFPEGPLKYACKIAGLPKPPSCL